MEILGLLDTLESVVLDSPKVPFTKKVVIDEEKLLGIIDKIRLVLQGGGDFARKAIGRVDLPVATPEPERETTNEDQPTQSEGRQRGEAKAMEVIEQAYQMAKEIRDGADKYADEVLANLEATSTRILRTIKAGRDRLNKNKPAEEQS